MACRVARAAVAGILACLLSNATSISISAQTLRGALPAQPRPRTLGELEKLKAPDRFGTHSGPILGERFVLGNAALLPGGRWLMDVLPLDRGGARGTYQLSLEMDGTWRLIAEDRTLASRGVLDATYCEAALQLEGEAGIFATIVAHRGAKDFNFRSRYAPVLLEVKQAGRTHKSQVEFTMEHRAIHPARFTLSARDGEKAEFRFRDAALEVHHRKPKIFDERTLANVAAFVMNLPTLLGLGTPEDEIDRVRRRCA